ncbi:uncharacterized protein LOC143533838 [Bidens hawaiensis]|uniref:uncharacterized protein LOC143533838 n=1 Tax=Bidens hawaiensis TaxID=980011 RepID=UPI00404905BF
MEVPGKVQTAPVAPPVEKKSVEVRPSPLLKINLPFIESLQHMPKYAKFLKDLLKRKDRLGEVSSIPLMGDCSVVVLNRVPDKLSDPGVFTIPCLFGSDAMSHALADLVASIDSCFDYICGANLVGSNGLVDCDDLGEDESCENDSVCDELVEISGLPEIIEVNEISCEREAYSVEKPAPLELKVLPSHLEYAYLDEGSNLPVIVSSKLTVEQKTKLIEVLKLHKGAIAWRLSDIQGISPSYCTHRILIEDEYKPVVQPQRRLNLNIQEVVKKEVLKLMDVGMIYPISDSPWVSPTQVVPNKGGMTVVMNEKNELIPSRTVTDCKTLNGAQENYTTTKKKLLAVVFAFDKFCSYLVLSKTTVFTDHAILCFLFQKKDAKPRLIRWILLLSEFDIEIKDKRGAENVAADHLSRLEDPKREQLREKEIGDTFPHESIDFVVAEKQGYDYATKEEVFRDVNRYLWDDPFLFKIGGDRILRRCVTKKKGWDILKHVHEGLTGGHHGAHATV